jgi:hypothetical protein
MIYIKLFEAFSQEQYKKAFSHIKSLLDKDAPKEDIVKFIDAFTGDVAKDLDNLRLIIERTQREFNNGYLHYHFYNRKTKTSRKRTDGSDYNGSWKAGDVVSRDTFDTTKYYMFPQRDDSTSRHQYGHNRRDQQTAREFFESQKSQYNTLIKKLSHLNITRVKFFCDRFFEILNWVVETGPTKYEISRSNMSDEQKRTAFEELNDFDMDNENEEVNKIVNRVKNEIQNLISTI